MMGVFAELERAMIQERVNAALARGKAEGKTLGGPKIAPETVAGIREYPCPLYSPIAEMMTDLLDFASGPEPDIALSRR